jgi:hypothetical protein
VHVDAITSGPADGVMLLLPMSNLTVAQDISGCIGILKCMVDAQVVNGCESVIAAQQQL